MKATILLALLALSCTNTECPNGRRWSPEPERDDLRACNMARAGEGSGWLRFDNCMHSLGYRKVCR